MKGLELSRIYYEECGREFFMKQFPQVMERAAVGLVGPGSDCFGFDDEYSRDHDWGPAFCIWLNSDDWAQYGAAMNELYASLPGSWRGFAPRQNSRGEAGRVGVMSIAHFYGRYTGRQAPPKSLAEWDIPENYLALATNGEIFVDGLGEFSGWRKMLLAYYPEDIRRKKIADCCMKIGQAGQYNWQRALQRGDAFVMMESKQQFCREAMGLLFILNRVYAPYFKWLFRGAGELPQLGGELVAKIDALLRNNSEMSGGWQKVQDGMMEVVALLLAELYRQKIITGRGEMLIDHVPTIIQTIEDDDYRRMQWGGA